jgi:hypothetical protein
LLFLKFTLSTICWLTRILMAEHQPASTWYTRRPPKELEDRDRGAFSLQVLSVHADLDIFCLLSKKPSLKCIHMKRSRELGWLDKESLAVWGSWRVVTMKRWAHEFCAL